MVESTKRCVFVHGNHLSSCLNIDDQGMSNQRDISNILMACPEGCRILTVEAERTTSSHDLFIGDFPCLYNISNGKIETVKHWIPQARPPKVRYPYLSSLRYLHTLVSSGCVIHYHPPSNTVLALPETAAQVRPFHSPLWTASPGIWVEPLGGYCAGYLIRGLADGGGLLA
jgi:hypothetical protein